MRGALPAARGEDRIADAFAALEYTVVPEADDAQAVRSEHGRSQRVLLKPLGMAAAVELDHQPGLNAKKIDDEGADADLTPPLPTAELAIAQRRPEVALGIGLGGT
nr:hypothetical protein [Phenylobacterium sp.]